MCACAWQLFTRHGVEPGGHAFSSDGGRRWSFAGAAYNQSLRYKHGNSTRLSRRERPEVLSLDGKPSLLFTGVLGKYDGAMSWTLVQPIAT